MFSKKFQVYSIQTAVLLYFEFNQILYIYG